MGTRKPMIPARLLMNVKKRTCCFWRRNFRSAALAVAVIAFHAGQGMAQGAFPAPLPGKTGTVNDPAFPPVNGVAGAPPFGNAPAPTSFPGAGSTPLTNSPFAAPPAAGAIDECLKKFLPLREEAEKRGKLLKAASDKHSGADEACKLIKSFIQAEVKMMKYIQTNAARCGIPPQIADQLKAGHQHSEEMQTKICTAAEQQQKQAPSGPSLSDVLGSAATLPEATAAKKSGSGVFDTLQGNPLTR
jgi:hypothetical protein